MEFFVAILTNLLNNRVIFIGTIGEDNDQNSNEPYQDNKLHHNER